MAEFCRDCFIRTWRPTQDEIDHIVMSDDNDFCEGCMDCGPYVLYIGNPEDKEQHVNYDYNELFEELYV